MKKPLLSYFTVPALALGLLISAQSCKKSDFQDAPASNSPAAGSIPNISALREAVANSVGMPLDQVVYNSNEKEFVVDGDGLITLEDAQARFGNDGTTAGSANEVQQRKYTYTVKPSIVTNIKVYADATVPSSWVAILDASIANWNNYSGSAVHFSRVTSATGANTTIAASYNNTTNVIAVSNYPDYTGNPGKKTTINTYYSTLTDVQKEFAITHELGHIIGFCHTNSTTGYLITGTTNDDPNSIMNASCLSWTAFTNYDLAAFQTVYPK